MLACLHSLLTPRAVFLARLLILAHFRSAPWVGRAKEIEVEDIAENGITLIVLKIFRQQSFED